MAGIEDGVTNDSGPVPDAGGAAAPVDPMPALDAAYPQVLDASPFLRRALQGEGLVVDGDGAAAARDWLLERACRPWDESVLQSRYRAHLAAAALPAEAAVARALRRTRREQLCTLLMRDAAGLAPLEEVTGAMTALAELAVRELLRAIVPPLAARYGTPLDAEGQPLDLLVLGMGKAGGGELNVSSDLDLIFVCGDVQTLHRADAAAPAAGNIDGQEFFDRLGRSLIAALGAVDDIGFVFRVDMRLRPHGDSGPLVIGLAMLEEYLLREGREWERFAWAKARVISGPVLAGDAGYARSCAALDALVQPFVYRKYFDFGAIGAIRDLHRRIANEARRAARPSISGAPSAAAAAAPVHDVKLGRGGIREIEFLAQTYSVMRGGRDRRLRARGTVATLQTLGRLQLLDPAEARRLVDDYRFLRRLEHALQYREDAQTHRIPEEAPARTAVARLLGMASAAALLERYRQVSEEVARSFDGLFPAGQPAALAPDLAPGGAALAAADEIDAARLQACGFADPPASAERLRRLFESPRLAAMSPAARAAVGRLAVDAVRLIAAGAATPDPAAAAGSAGADELLLRWIRLIEVIGRRSTYFALLVEYPRAHERVLRLLGAGGWPTEYLLRHPILLDELIDPRPDRFAGGPALDDLPPVPGAAEPYWAPWVEEVRGQLHDAAGDMERQMNILRDAHHAQVFRLLLADLGGALQLEHLADHLSALADGVLALALEGAWRSLDASPDHAAPRLAIVAYGKLGGRELGYASDLDLAFVYDEGADPVAAERNAALATQLVRRLLTWLTSATSSGLLFEIDLRLRPNGNAGLLVTPMAAFERYQANADGHGAWIWEHQALTRARACAGDPQLGAAVERIRAQVLARPRDPLALAAEVVAMRRRMLEGHANRSGRYDLKHDRGGMVDIEFVVQFLVLAHARREPALLANRGNIALLAVAAELGYIAPELARDAAAAYRRYRRLQHALRLDGQQQARIARDRVDREIASVLHLWRTVLGTDDPAPAHAAR